MSGWTCWSRSIAFKRSSTRFCSASRPTNKTKRCIGREPELGADRTRIDRGRLIILDPRVDHGQPVVGHAERAIKVDHRVRVADQAVAPGRQPAVDKPLDASLPQIHGHLRHDHHWHPRQPRRDPSISIGRENPGLDHVERPGLQEPRQPSQRDRIKLEMLADRRDRNPGRTQLGFQWTQPGQRRHLDPEPVARQPLGQHHHLLLSPRAVECRDQLQDFEHDHSLAVGSRRAAVWQHVGTRRAYSTADSDCLHVFLKQLRCWRAMPGSRIPARRGCVRRGSCGRLGRNRPTDR